MTGFKGEADRQREAKEGLAQILSDMLVLLVNMERVATASGIFKKVEELGILLPPSRYTCSNLRLFMEHQG